MSNSIWKTPDQNPKNYQSIMFITKNKSTRSGIFKDGFYYDDANNQYEDDELECWATIYDVKAQADKAERLQKAVDKALDTLDYVSNEKFATEDGDFFEEYEEMHKAIKQDIDEIKQLIKGDKNE